jgi:membrane protein DedA with SNARE-associated domain
MLLGRPIIIKYGKFLMLNEKHLAATEKWFGKNGSRAIFIGRLIPVVRHLISIPAGFARMDLLKFSAFTFAGALLWCSILTYAGIFLKENWHIILNYTEIIDLFIAAVIVFAVVFFYFKYTRKK